MKYSKVFINSIAYEKAPIVVTSEELEARVAPVYKKFHIPMGQLSAMTGIEERRWWPENFNVSEGAAKAAQKALDDSGANINDIGAIIYTGVCREQHEPATACRVADILGASRDTFIYDISSACLGVMTGMIDVANRIELGQIKAGLVVSCESARDIVDIMIQKMLDDPSMENFSYSLATLTGGSGAVAVLLTDGSLDLSTDRSHQLLGASSKAAPEFNDLCHWGHKDLGNHLKQEYMRTDAVSLLQHGVDLARETWDQFLSEHEWTPEQVNKVICHQVGSANRLKVLGALNIPEYKEYPGFQLLGNMGSVALPTTAALAHDNGFLKPRDNVGFLGIGSGLTCMMLGIKW